METYGRPGSSPPVQQQASKSGEKNAMPTEDNVNPPSKSSSWFDWDINRSEWDVLLLSTALKLLLFPA